MKNIKSIQSAKTIVRKSPYKVILTAMFVLVNVLANAQNSIIENRIAPKELKQDFQILRASLEEGYPGLYRYNSKSFTDSLFVASEKQLQKEMTEREFFLFVSKVVMQLHDGHMDVYPSENVVQKLRNNSCTIPLQAFISGRKMYIQKNYSTLSDKELLGAEIISINNQSVSSIITEVLKICTSDGNNQTNKFKRLESSGLLTEYLIFLQGYTESYKIEYRRFNNPTVKTATLKGILYADLLKIRKSKYHFTEPLPAEFKIISPETAYLKIRSFNKADYKNSKMDFIALLESSFKTIKEKGVKNLILDVRDNGGGTDAYGKILFSYFINHEFIYYDSLIVNKEKYNFMKYTNSPDLEFPDDALHKNQSGTFDVIDHPNVGIQQNSLPNFSGKILVLINGNCFSTTSEFLSMLKSYTPAVFIGEESGGGYYGNCSGSVPHLILPNSLLEEGIPLMKYSMAVKNYKYKDRGIIPDYDITPTIKDKLLGNDPEFEFAKKLIYESGK